MLSQLSIRNRLFAAFGLILVLLLAVAAAGAAGVYSARQSLDIIVGRLQPLRAEAENLNVALLRARVAEQTMVANNLDNEAIAGHKKAWDQAMRDAATAQDKLRGLVKAPE